MIYHVSQAFDAELPEGGSVHHERGSQLTQEQYDNVRRTANYRHIGNVQILPDDAAARIGMRDATPNKPVHSNVGVDDATVGYSGGGLSRVIRDDLNEKMPTHRGIDISEAGPYKVDVAPNEGDDRRSVHHDSVSEHAGDANWRQAFGVPPNMEDQVGTTDPASTDDGKAQSKGPKIEQTSTPGTTTDVSPPPTKNQGESDADFQKRLDAWTADKPKRDAAAAEARGAGR